MTFNTYCESCGNSFEIPNHYVGKSINCVHCKATIVAIPIVETTPLRIDKPVASDSTTTNKKRFFSYSLQIEVKPPFLYKFFSWVSLVALINYIFYFYQWHFELTNEQRTISQLAGASILDNLWYVIALFGAAQLIRFIHSIAWNIQELKEFSTQSANIHSKEETFYAALEANRDQQAEDSLSDIDNF